MKGRLLFLGTGGSLGVPIIGCTCATCSSSSSFNKRLRPSALLKIEDKTFLIDVGPDFREQALKYGITALTGVILTHSHYDHIGGLDDLRALHFKQKKQIPCLLAQETLNEIGVRYHYLMRALENGNSLCPQLNFCVLQKNFGHIEFEGVPFTICSYFQAGMKVTGYRIGNLAYISDIRDYGDEVVEQLKGVETLIVSALRMTASDVHFSVEEAIAFSKQVGAKRTYLTHIAHDLEYESTNLLLPEDVRLAYDGLEITCEL